MAKTLNLSNLAQHSSLRCNNGKSTAFSLISPIWFVLIVMENLNLITKFLCL